MLTKHNKVLSTTVKVLAMTFMVAACYVRPAVESQIHTDARETNMALDEIRRPRQADHSVLDTVRAKDDIWLGDRSVRASLGDPLPSRFETSNGVTMVLTSDHNLLEIAERITDLTGIPVRIDDLVIEQVQEAFESGGLTASIVPGAGDRPGSANITERENSRFNARFSYTGRLSGLLDLMSTRFNLWWRYSEGTIVFYEMDTRVFTVFALPTITNVNTRIGGSGNDGGTGGGGSVGSASNQMATRVDFDMWKQIEQSISGILPGNATFTISPSSGQITVTAPPSSLRKVARYVNDLNLRLSRQVVIGVQLLSITMTENDHYGLDLNAIFSQNGLTAGFSSGFNSAWNPATGGETGGLGVTIVGGSSRRLNKLAGSRAIIEALSTQGKTSLVTSTSVTTLNNRVAPVQVSLVRPYVDSMGTVVSDGIASTTITQAQLNLGFTMQILPRILDHGRLMLSFSITLTELLEMEDFRFGFEGRDRVQQPHVDSRAFSQEVAMMSGQTLVLTGFERVDSSTNRSGIGNARNTLLGGRAYTERERVVMAILITPEVVVSPLSPETRVADMF